MQLWYCLRIAGKLLGEIGVDIYRQFVVGGAVYSCFWHHKFPQAILLSDCEGIIIVKDVLGGRDDLGGCLLLLFALSLLAEEIRFGTLELLDLLGQGCISLGEHIDGVHTLFQVFADVFLLTLELSELSTDSFQCSSVMMGSCIPSYNS